SVRKRRGVTRDPAARDAQFRYIASQKEKYIAAGLPIISVDTKKKELIGNFRNNGQAWCREGPEVSEHGFASEAPYLSFGNAPLIRSTVPNPRDTDLPIPTRSGR